MSRWNSLEVIENRLNAWRWEHEKLQQRADQALGIVIALEKEIEARQEIDHGPKTTTGD